MWALVSKEPMPLRIRSAVSEMLSGRRRQPGFEILQIIAPQAGLVLTEISGCVDRGSRMGEFCFHSIELRGYSERHTCVVLNVVDGNKVVVEITPPIPGYLYGQKEDLSRAVFAPRHVGVSITPEISGWPCFVNLCLPKENGSWTAGPWSLLDIGELTRT